MKIFFDTNVYVAEALIGKVASRIVSATLQAKWRVYTSNYVLEEVRHVLVDYFEFSPRLAVLSQQKIQRRSEMVIPKSMDEVPGDPKDSPVLQAALTCGAHYLVTNDQHLLELNPYKSLRIISMKSYLHLLKTHGHIS